MSQYSNPHFMNSTANATPLIQVGRGRGMQGLSGMTSSLQQRVDTDDDQSIHYTSSVMNKQQHMLREQIDTKLLVETWLWEREQSHRLFNFHEGYRKLEDGFNMHTELIGSHIIGKNGPNDILFH